MERASLVLPGSEQVTGDEVVGRARAMVPRLRENAARTEEARRVLPETVEAFKQAGFFRVCQPRRFGGFELGFDVQQRVLIELARGCASSAWALGILSGHSWFMAMGFPEDGQRDIFGDDGHAMISTTLQGRGVAKPVEGGYRISGRYPNNSGCDFANWTCVGAYLEGGDGTPASGLFCAIRPEQRSIEDNWYVLGMRGTGSKVLHVEDQFVPERLALPMHLVNSQETPGTRVHPNPMYGAPWRAFVSVEVTGTAVGIAQQAVEVLDDIMRSKPVRVVGGPPSTASQMELPLMRRRLAEAQSRVDAARALLLSDAVRLQETQAEYAAQGRKFEADELASYALHAARVVELCTEAVDHCFLAAGTSAAFAGHPMERCLRDMKMMATHAAYRFDLASERWGTAHFGLA